jgi:hypothetical protein
VALVSVPSSRISTAAGSEPPMPCRSGVGSGAAHTMCLADGRVRPMNHGIERALFELCWVARARRPVIRLSRAFRIELERASGLSWRPPRP